MKSWAELELALTARISGERLQHVYRVVATARELSDQFGAPSEKAEAAALMHDWARSEAEETLLQEAERLNLITDPSEQQQPLLLHGPVAAAWLRSKGLIADDDVLNAVRWHTTGRASMSLLEKIIWLADYIEPGRNFFGVEQVRAAARTELDVAMLLGLEQTIAFVLKQGWPLHLASVQARDWFLAQR